MSIFVLVCFGSKIWSCHTHTWYSCSNSNSYTRELPSRFKKEVVRAAATNDRIVLDGMTRVLANIGAENGLSAKEMKVIFDELGNSAGEIPAHRLVQIL